MIYIRTDMNKTIATGHVMRCLAVADAAKSIGEDTTFLVADIQAADLFSARGYRYVVLQADWDDMESELPALNKVIEEKKIKRILIDSYQVTPSYLEALTKMVQTFYIDDINAFRYPVDAVICYANYWEKYYDPENEKGRRLYLGPKYAPLRPAFCESRKKEIKPKIENLLLLSGGRDQYHIFDGLLEQMDKSRYQQIHVICGVYDPNYQVLRKKYAGSENVFFHRAIADMERYMKAADLAVSAGGTTLYELCACGTPTISYSFVDNQLKNVYQLHQTGTIDYAGDLRRDGVIENVICYLEEYYADPEKRQDRSQKMQQLVDGKGALRIAEALMESRAGE